MQQSVIISTYNQPAWLAKVLCGYLEQTFKDFELLIADDGSDSRTAEVIANFQQIADFPVKHIWHPDEGFQKCAILNKATLSASADYLIFTDGDCVPRKDFLATHARFAQPGVFLSGSYNKLSLELSLTLDAADIASGRAFSISWLRKRGLRGFSQFMRLGASDRQAAILDRISPTKATWNGHGSSTWKQNLLEVNGHNEDMKYGGEDRELGERLMNLGLRGKRIRYRAILLHLDHQRAYKTQAELEKNRAIRSAVIASGSTWCANGILKQPCP